MRAPSGWALRLLRSLIASRRSRRARPLMVPLYPLDAGLPYATLSPQPCSGRGGRPSASQPKVPRRRGPAGGMMSRRGGWEDLGGPDRRDARPSYRPSSAGNRKGESTNPAGKHPRAKSRAAPTLDVDHLPDSKTAEQDDLPAGTRPSGPITSRAESAFYAVADLPLRLEYSLSVTAAVSACGCRRSGPAAAPLTRLPPPARRLRSQPCSRRATPRAHGE
jgi:hypothetical protein